MMTRHLDYLGVFSVQQVDGQRRLGNFSAGLWRRPEPAVRGRGQQEDAQKERPRVAVGVMAPATLASGHNQPEATGWPPGQRGAVRATSG